jgi:protein TonB
MGIMKNIGKPEVRYQYKLVFKGSLIVSLLIMILAFKYFPKIERKSFDLEATQELFTVEDIQQTKQDYTPPPPPEKPSMIIQTISDAEIEDIEFGETELDFDQELSAPPPPPQQKQKIDIVEEESIYFVAVEEMPYPIGGINAIQQHIIYPEIAKRAGIEGKVFILAYVDEDGTVTKAEILKRIGGGCDEAAAKAVLQTKFSPGKQRGKPVKVKVMIPIRFELAEDSV